MLEITEINYRLGYVSVKDTITNKEYFSQGDDGSKDIDYIEKNGEEAFLDCLASSGYFDGVQEKNDD